MRCLCGVLVVDGVEGVKREPDADTVDTKTQKLDETSNPDTKPQAQVSIKQT